MRPPELVRHAAEEHVRRQHVDRRPHRHPEGEPNRRPDLANIRNLCSIEGRYFSLQFAVIAFFMITGCEKIQL